ncbi:MAG TPA: hypothetical protein VIG25_06150, partial [Pyrinomonadaceae bacterium]
FGYIAFINLLLGTTIGTPLVCFGRSKVKRAVRLLSKSQNEASPSVLDEAQRRYNLPASGFNTQSPLPTPQSSITENTTLNLRRAEHVHRRPS